MNNKLAKKTAHEVEKIRRQILASLAVIAFLLILLIPLASTSPDGLERVAGDLGVSEGSGWQGLLPGYGLPLGNEMIGTFLAGMIGVLIVFTTMFLVARLFTLRRNQKREQE
nr:PDGLE domain-containing protein [Candidatus Njordarchaeota archaeon]